MTKLEKMLKYVSEHNEFYKKRIKEYEITNPLDITQWPILTREELQENRYNMFSDGYKTKYYNQQLHRQTSSGSSGVPVNVYWDHADLAKSNIALWRLRAEYYGITPKSRKVMFTLAAFNTNHNNKNVCYTYIGDNLLAFNVPSIQRYQSFLQVINIIKEFDPEWLYIQPSVLMQLASYYKEYNIAIPKSLKYIESVGEVLTETFQKEMIGYFNIPVVNMYGSEEHNGIAFECPHKHMHIIDENVFFEVIPIGEFHHSNEGKSIITNLNNLAMPLIRYDQGDIVEMKQSNITYHCGNYSPIITVVKGRQYEIIYDNEHQISALLLSEIVSEVQNQYNDPIKKFYFVYNRSNKCLTLYISLRAQSMLWHDTISAALSNTYKSRISYNSMITFQVCDYPIMKDNDKYCDGKHKILRIEE